MKLNELLLKLIEPLMTPTGPFQHFIEPAINSHAVSLYLRAIAPNQPMDLKAIRKRCTDQTYVKDHPSRCPQPHGSPPASHPAL